MHELFFNNISGFDFKKFASSEADAKDIQTYKKVDFCLDFGSDKAEKLDEGYTA